MLLRRVRRVNEPHTRHPRVPVEPVPRHARTRVRVLVVLAVAAVRLLGLLLRLRLRRLRQRCKHRSSRHRALVLCLCLVRQRTRQQVVGLLLLLCVMRLWVDGAGELAERRERVGIRAGLLGVGGLGDACLGSGDLQETLEAVLPVAVGAYERVVLCSGRKAALSVFVIQNGVSQRTFRVVRPRRLVTRSHNGSKEIFLC